MAWLLYGGQSPIYRINGHAGQDPIEDGGTNPIEKRPI